MSDGVQQLSAFRIGLTNGDCIEEVWGQSGRAGNQRDVVKNIWSAALIILHIAPCGSLNVPIVGRLLSFIAIGTEMMVQK